MANNNRLPAFRNAAFGLADARGNIPHLTRETADHEGRRLNAQRYETVGDMDRALDARARPRPITAVLGAAPAPPSSDLLGPLLLVLLGAGIAYVLTRKAGDDDDDADGADTVDSEVLRSNPAGVAPSGVTAPLALPAAPTNVTVVVPPPKRTRRRRNAEVVPVVVIPPEEKPTKRKRRTKVPKVTASASAITAPVENPVVIVAPPPAVDRSEPPEGK